MEIEPLLDKALARLGEKERDLVLLRYFENTRFKEEGHALEISEDAAQKWIARALENCARI